LEIIGPDDSTAAGRKSLLNIFEQLVDEGFLKNNCELVTQFGMPWGQRLLQALQSMNNLEKLDIMEHDVTFADLAHLFHSCPNITHLNLKLVRQDKRNRNEDLSQDQLKLGFQKLKHLGIAGDIFHGNLFLEIFPYTQYYIFKERRY
jgi:hypothetical protein